MTCTSGPAGHAAIAAAVALAVLLGGCIARPEDPVEVGHVCVPPADDCSATTLLDRDAVGRNQLDYAVFNEGDAEVVVDVIAAVPRVEPYVDESGNPVRPEDADIVTSRKHTLAPGGSALSRFTPQDIGTRDELELVLLCDGCEARLDYVFNSVPLECFEDDECSSGWVCDEVFGRCVECVSEEECNEDQTCEEDRGRCTPEEEGGCQTAEATPAILPLLVLLVLFLRRRRRHLAGAVLASALLLSSIPADAAAPRASLSLGTGPRFVTGDLGRDTKRGIGLVFGQELRWRYFGAMTGLSTSFFLTTQDPPPFSHTLQTFALTIGPRGYVPIGPLEIVVGPDYKRLGLLQNSLVKQTGTERTFNAVGGTVDLRYRWQLVEFRLAVGFHPIFELPGSLLTIDLTAALATGL